MAQHNDVILGGDAINCNLGCMKEPAYIKIFKGYSTYFNGKHLIHIGITGIYSEQPRTYKFLIGGVVKTYQNVTTGFFVDLTAADTGSLNLGPINGTIIAVDDQGNETPLTTAIPFIVENWIQGDIDVDQVDITITVTDGDVNDYVINLKSPYFETILHNDLQRRDVPNCHPIKAITGLQDDLDSKQDVIEDLGTIRDGAALGATALQEEDIHTGSTNGTINVRGRDVPVYGLKSAAYTPATDYDRAGEASNALAQAKSYADQKDATNLQNAKAYADSLAPNYATAAQGEKADSAIQTVMVNGTELQKENNAVDVPVPTNNNQLTNGAGYITAQALEPYVPKTTSVNGKALSGNITLTYSDVDALPETTTINDLTTQEQQAALNSGATQTNIGQITTNQNAIGTLSNLTTTTQTDLVSALNEVNGIAGTALQPEDVIDNTSSTTTNKPLSANMGKSLQDQVNNLKQRGHFLSLWNCATGLAQSNPPQSTYTYQTGDYFIIGTVATGSGTNYRPNGSSYTTGVASTTVETQAVDENDIYYYDGTNWLLQINTQKTTTFGSIEGDPYDNTSLGSALNAKQDTLTQGTGIAIDSNTNTISNSGVRAISTGSTNGTISVNTNGTSADVSVKGLGSAAYTPSTDYATSAQGSKADTAIQSVTTGSTNGTISVDGTDVQVYGLGSAAYTPSSDYATAAQGTKADTALQNTATGTDSLTILGTATTNTDATNVGIISTATGIGATSFGWKARAMGNNATSLGGESRALGYGTAVGYHALTNNYSASIGYDCNVSGDYSICIGTLGRTSGNKKFDLSFPINNSTPATDESTGLFTLLDGSTGKIPVGRYTAMTGADGTNAGVTGSVPAPTATDNTKFLKGDGTWDSALQNTATGTSSLTILGTAATGASATNIGNSSTASSYATSVGHNAQASSSGSVALGYNTRTTANYTTAIGSSARSTATGAITLGAFGRNSEAKTFKVAFSDSNNPATDEASGLFTLLDSSGKIPGGRMSIQGSGAPTTSTAGSVGQFYVDTTNEVGYLCVGVSSSTYTWKKVTDVGGGGGGIGFADFSASPVTFASGSVHTLDANYWISSNASVKLDSNTGTQIISGGSKVWFPLPAGTKIYPSGGDVTAYPML